MELKIPPGPFAAYIFDCDGTLAHTMPVHYRAWLQELQPYGVEFSEELFYQLGGTPTAKIVEILSERSGIKLDAKTVLENKEKFFYDFLSEVKSIAAVEKFVREMHGKAPLAVASGGHRESVTKTLRQIGLLDFFSVIVTAEDYANGKPSPDPFLEAASRLKVDPKKCLVFEDTNIGIQAAEAAGMQWVLVPR